MKSTFKYILGAAALTLLAAAPTMADTTKAVTEKSSTVNPDGSVSYQSHTIVTKDPAPATTATTTSVVSTGMPVMTFYYYEPSVKRIVSAGDLTPVILSLWDTDNNKVIDNHEFYNDAMIMYEPIEYTKRTYQDIDGDGVADLTTEEYTQRLERLPMYSTLNKNGKPGLTIFEFTGVGFQDADNDNDNQVTFDELKEAFYHEKGLAPKPEKINK